MLFSNHPLPTPTSTSASVISDEDVALQLMRLNDPSATPILSPSIVDEEEHEDPVLQSGAPQHQETNLGHSRCTNCITSKKGCDKKRPCGRCVQQGLEEWQCMSDDERGTARKKIAALRRSTMMGRSIGRARRSTRP